MSVVGENKPPGNAAAFDPTMVLRRIGADMQLFAELVEMFVEDVPPLFDDIRLALAGADQQRLVLAAHTLCGAIGNFTVDGPYELAKRVEALGRANDFASVRQNLDALVNRVAELTASLKQCVRQSTA